MPGGEWDRWSWYTDRRTVVIGSLGAAAATLAGCGPQAGTGRSGVQSAGSGFANPQLVVSVQWLLQHLKDPGLRIVDTRPAAAYAAGHLLGAVNLPVTDTFDPTKQNNYPDTREKLEQLFSSKGIGNTLHIITYDGGRSTQAPRLFWTLEYLGHQKVSYLDGGLSAWQAAGGEVSTAVPAVPAAQFTAKADPARMATKQSCLLAIGDKTKVVLDARSPAEYRGEDVRAKRGGHIPGAVNIDWVENFIPNTTFLKDAATLRQMYESKGVTRDKEVIAHCQTGQRSSVSYLVLRLLGYPKVGNYAGSWVEWGNDPDTPIVTGG